MTTPVEEVVLSMSSRPAGIVPVSKSRLPPPSRTGKVHRRLRIVEGPRLPQRLGDLAAERIQDPELAALQGDLAAEVPQRLTPTLRDAVELRQIQSHADVLRHRVQEVSKLPLVPAPELAGARDHLEPDLVLERWSDLRPPEESHGLILVSATPARNGLVQGCHSW